MSFLNKFLKKQQKEQLEKRAEKAAASDLKPEKKAKKPALKSVKISKVKEGARETKGASVKKTAKRKFQAQSHAILIKPLITEKISEMAALGKYAFMVSLDANKIMVKKAVNALYGVDVKNVRIINMLGKKVRYGRSFGHRKDWKKAVVTLAPGEKIEVYEGV